MSILYNGRRRETVTPERNGKKKEGWLILGLGAH